MALAGVNVIPVSRAAYTDVRLPRAVDLATPFSATPDVQVSGGGGLIAFVLVGQEARTQSMVIAGGASTVSGVTEKFLLPVPQSPSFGGGSFEETKTFSNTTRVPAGAYRLYVVSAARGTITLRMRGLQGTKTIAAKRSATGFVAPADHEVAGNPARENVFAATNSTTLKRRGFALQALQARMEAEAAWQLVMCHNNPADSAAAPLRDAPACPAGEKHTLVTRRYPAVVPDTKLFVQAFAGLPAREHGMGAVFTSESYVTSIGYSTLWLEY